MKIAKKLAIFFLLFPLTTHAATVESLIKKADKLNDECRGGSGDNPNTWKACEQRDKVISDIKSKGWCFGNEEQASYEKKWQKCSKPKTTTTDKVINKSYEDLAPTPGGIQFTAMGKIHLKSQLSRCENYQIAGNLDLFKSCTTRTLNAYDYILDKAYTSNIPQTGWAHCYNYIDYDFPTGAQCLASVEMMCPLGENGQLENLIKCTQVINSGAWLSNPKIQRMTFTSPAR